MFLSLLAGLCCLVPIPFLDDHLRNRVRRHMVMELARRHNIRLARPTTRWLAVGPPHTLGSLARGCLTGATLKVVFYIVGKLLRSTFRKILYFLAIKDATDTFSLTFHHGWLFHHALASGHVGNADDATDAARAARVRTAIEATCRAIDPRPLEAGLRSVLRGSRATLSRAARRFARSSATHPDDEPGSADPLDARTLAAEEAILDEVVDELEDQVAAADNHLARLVAHYKEAHSMVQYP